ncbi:acyl-CoA synthetase [Brachybacterium endophyticum]|uniref:Acyl-CoA synthetase n=1 Tax=Brachybacterium endophyticum TaxID=2182385 RepID=A0A2U2RPE8_9MICO|nr:AMP-binding protein [Brachybacterium endophyticum]PWH07753.1 acyl-CoA synthetase [Brachybacterium endophyticum]
MTESTGPEAPWLRPAPWDGSARSLAEHADAVGQMMAGRARLWLGPFDPPAHLPAGFEDTVLVVPTSGSTGGAKAVAHPVASLLASQDATAQLFAQDGTVEGLPASGGHGHWLPLLPPTHIAGIQVLARAHRAQRALGLARVPLADPLPDLAAHFDAAHFAELAAPALAQAHDAGLPAFTSLVPTQLTRILADASADGARARSLLSRFAAVLVGGAATPPDLLARARGARARVRTTYGSSETAGGCVYDGVPLPGVRLEVTGPGPEGRLRISSPTLATGYLLPDGTARTEDFPADGPQGERVFATSDLARLDEGRLQILGRADDVITTGGLKVVPQDVERAIERSLMLRGLVAEAVVVGVPDPEWGSAVEALVVPTAQAPEPADLPALVRSALRTTGVPGHAVPRRVHLVEALPLHGIGKIDRAQAARIAAAHH